VDVWSNIKGQLSRVVLRQRLGREDMATAVQRNGLIVWTRLREG